jgi:hypothetical protein
LLKDGQAGGRTDRDLVHDQAAFLKSLYGRAGRRLTRDNLAAVGDYWHLGLPQSLPLVVSVFH